MSPPPKLRKRPALIVAGVAVTAFGCLLGAWAWSATTNTVEVLAARDTIHRGEMITAEDLQRVRINGDPALEPLAASAYDDIVGQRAALDVAAGGLLTAESTTEESLPPQGQSIVGISLTPAQVPALPMHGGDKVRIVLTPGTDGDVSAGSAQFTGAEVVDTSLDETTGNTIVNVLVPYGDAGLLAARAATGNVALILDSGDQ
ncbi:MULTISPECIES: SAF domain-containing protein [unclassified Nocardioides]|uniref:SAF domain-containing protein n=1 Tax=unclassified Nocardioides TaxID=2615069 RepID=UPI00138F0458|nr:MULTISPECIES: SAF domain-containing protein [unclassified Nocardioides]